MQKRNKLISPILKVDGLVKGPHAPLSGHVRIGEAQASHGQEASVLRQRYLRGNTLFEFPAKKKIKSKTFPDVVHSQKNPSDRLMASAAAAKSATEEKNGG